MNPNQLATLAECAQISALLGKLGGGVTSTYIPEYDGPYAAPEDGDAKFYHFAFADGASGFNAGLIRTLMKQCPTTWPIMVATEINYQKPQVPASADDVAPAPPAPAPLPPAYSGFPPLKPGYIMTPFGPAKAAV